MNKKDKERLTAAERIVWGSERMVKHCVDHTLLLFDLRGKIVTIEKCKVNTHFCFGYSDFDNRSRERAEQMSAHARKSEIYFLRQNHKEAKYAWKIARINDKNNIVYAAPNYSEAGNIIYYIGHMNRWDYECKGLPENGFILTDEETRAYKLKLAEACKLHQKKLETYLKRHGLSKVETWTYWADE